MTCAGSLASSEIGVVSIAAPIRNATGTVVASLSLAGPSGRMDPNHQAYTAAVKVFARNASIQLGWSPGGDSPLLASPLPASREGRSRATFSITPLPW
ncbi:MAG: IclR family transcriptional regulator C-terminal domain-containing protein [Planctomycetota bacterium]